MSKKNFLTWLPLIFILILSAGLRTYRFNRPVGDWHSWRQADTVAVTRRYVREGVDLLHPKYDDLSNIPSGLDNLEGFRMVEFPFINALIASTYNLSLPIHHWPVHVYSRLINICFFLGSTVFLYLIVQQLTDHKTARVSSAVYSLLPFGIFYSTTMLPEVPLLFFTLGAVYFWLQYCDQISSSPVSKTSYLSIIFFTVFAALAFLLKPIFIFVGPAMLYYLLKNKGIKSFIQLPLYISAIFILVPFFWWRHWITQFPEGIPDFSWLFNGNGIRFKPSFFRWLFADRLVKWILGYWGMLPFGLGILATPSKKSGWFFHWWLLGMVAYLTIFATGNVTHDYYQIFLLPIISITTGLGIVSMINLPRTHFNKFIAYCLLVITLVFTFAFSWFHVRDYFNINNPAIVVAGQAVDQFTPADSIVIAPYMGDTAFLYQTNRTGWPIGTLIPEKIKMGATHYITTSYDDEAHDLADRCQVLEHTELYTLIDLSDCKFEITNPKLETDTNN